MEKLYKSNGTIEYWEAWEQQPGTFIVHWGELGTRGQSKTISSGFFSSAEKKVEAEMDKRLKEGYSPIDEQSVLIIEYKVDGMGSEEDLQKRHALEDRMNELLGWTGLGACDGGSIGSGTMEVANLVVDASVAERVIREDLAGTEFGNFDRIYTE